jgi:F-type H+-transporting ATPase subunit gamma
MSKRAQIQRHLRALNEIGGIMGAMKNISLMETHKLARFLAHQHRVLAGIEATAADFLGHHPEIGYSTARAASGVTVAIGSQRGFCGDFNESVVDAINQHRRQVAKQPHGLLVVGRRLASRLGKDQRVTASFDGPSVAEEVQPVLHRLMTALSELQAQEGRTELLGITVIAHHEGDNQLAIRSILPVPNPGRFSSRFAYPPLLHLAAPMFFSELARHYLWAQMHDEFYSSLMAENRRRLQHMEGAIQRMAEKAGEMQRKYNMLRQEEITEEIEVIMLSNEALRKSAQSVDGIKGT